jgi:putative hemolysin
MMLLNRNNPFLRGGATRLGRKPQWLGNLHRKLVQMKISNFTPKVLFSIDVKNFRVKTAETSEELREVLKLRYDVFTKEFDVKMKFYDFDFDRYDLLGDHIVVLNKDTGKILATYRVISSLFSDRFYSQNEFTIDNFIQTPGVKMELGRACVHEEFRTGAAISLVWKGLAKYATLTDADYMFGCTSINTTDPQEAMAVFKHLEAEHFSGRYYIRPMAKYLFPKYPELVDVDKLRSVEDMLPSLFKSYLKAGAKIHSLPALDKDFSCIDLFTSLNLKEINEKYYRKYF